jgi:hypothetical protein
VYKARGGCEMEKTRKGRLPGTLLLPFLSSPPVLLCALLGDMLCFWGREPFVPALSYSAGVLFVPVTFFLKKILRLWIPQPKQRARPTQWRILTSSDMSEISNVEEREMVRENVIIIGATATAGPDSGHELLLSSSCSKQLAHV